MGESICHCTLRSAKARTSFDSCCIPGRFGRRCCGVALCVLGCDGRPVRKVVASLLVFVVCLGTCHANEFFETLVGHWKYVTETTVADDNNSTFPHKYKTTIRLLGSGVVYFETRGVLDGQQSLSKSWVYPKGTLRGVSYQDGEILDRTKGTWRMRRGMVFIQTSTASLVWRKVTNNKIVIEGTGSDGSRFNSTLTRVRN
jgi:hypothetical protein